MNTDTKRGRLAIRQLSLLRWILRFDLDIHTEPYNAELTPKEIEFLEICDVDINKRPFRGNWDRVWRLQVMTVGDPLSRCYCAAMSPGRVLPTRSAARRTVCAAWSVRRRSSSPRAMRTADFATDARGVPTLSSNAAYDWRRRYDRLRRPEDNVEASEPQLRGPLKLDT